MDFKPKVTYSRKNAGETNAVDDDSVPFEFHSEPEPVIDHSCYPFLKTIRKRTFIKNFSMFQFLEARIHLFLFSLA